MEIILKKVGRSSFFCNELKNNRFEIKQVNLLFGALERFTLLFAARDFTAFSHRLLQKVLQKAKSLEIWT